jgi:hypothetical protein
MPLFSCFAGNRCTSNGTASATTQDVQMALEHPDRTSAPADEPPLTEEEIAQDLRISVRTVQGWRGDNYGPPYMKIGRLIRYPRDLYRMWKKSNTKSPQ